MNEQFSLLTLIYSYSLMQSDRSTLKRMLQWTTYRTQLFFPYPITGGPNLLPFQKGTNLQSPEKLRDLQPLLNICNSDRQLKDGRMAGKFITHGGTEKPLQNWPTNLKTPPGKPLCWQFEDYYD